MPIVKKRTRLTAHQRFGSFAARFRRNVFEKARTQRVVESCLFGIELNEVRFDELKQLFESGCRQICIIVPEETAKLGTHAMDRECAVVVTRIIAVGVPLRLEFWGEIDKSLNEIRWPQDQVSDVQQNSC